jgi:hypothetical protein
VKTLENLTAETGLPVDPHLVLDLVIPVLDGFQAQGDLLVAPLPALRGQVTVRATASWQEVAPSGVELLRGAAGGNAHTLVADPGTCVWTTDVTDTEGLALAIVDAMAPVYLLHREHGGAGIAAGTYVIRRQRELMPPTAPRHRLDPATYRDVPRGVREEQAMQARVRYIAD